MKNLSIFATEKAFKNKMITKESLTFFICCGIIKEALEQSNSQQNSQKVEQEMLNVALKFSSDLLETEIEEFPNMLTKMYTQESFLYKTLNKYLRNDDISQLSNLFPYYLCF